MKKNVIKYALILVALVLSVFVLSGCENKQKTATENEIPVYTNENRKDFSQYKGNIDVKVSYPSSWVNISGDETEIAYTSDDGTGALMNVTTYETDLNLEQLVEESILDLKQKILNNKEIKKQKINLNGREAYKIEYIIKTETGNIENNENSESTEDSILMNLNYRFIQVAFIDNGKAYILTIAVQDDKYDDTKNRIDSIIKSFSK